VARQALKNLGGRGAGAVPAWIDLDLRPPLPLLVDRLARQLRPPVDRKAGPPVRSALLNQRLRPLLAGEEL